MFGCDRDQCNTGDCWMFPTLSTVTLVPVATKKHEPSIKSSIFDPRVFADYTFDAVFYRRVHTSVRNLTA